MSGDSSLELPSSDEIRSCAVKKKSSKREDRKRETDSDSSGVEYVKGLSESGSPEKLRRNIESLNISETVVERKYRDRRFPNVNNIFDELLACTACKKDLKYHVRLGRDVYKHPVLGVLLCKDCSEFYGDGDFSVDEDGTDKYCRWCGQGGLLYCCSKCSCAFCKVCVKRNLKRSVLNEIQEDGWECFICNPVPLYELRGVCVTAQAYVAKSKRKVKRERGKRLNRLSEAKRESKSSRHRTRADSSDESESESSSAKPSTSAVRSRRKSSVSDPDAPSTSKRKLRREVKHSKKSENNSASDSDSDREKCYRNKKARNKHKAKSDSENKNSESNTDSDTAISDSSVDEASATLRENFMDLRKLSKIFSRKVKSLQSKVGSKHMKKAIVSDIVKSTFKLVNVITEDLKNINENLDKDYNKWESRVKSTTRKKKLKAHSSKSDKNISKCSENAVVSDLSDVPNNGAQQSNKIRHDISESEEDSPQAKCEVVDDKAEDAVSLDTKPKEIEMVLMENVDGAFDREESLMPKDHKLRNDNICDEVEDNGKDSELKNHINSPNSNVKSSCPEPNVNDERKSEQNSTVLETNHPHEEYVDISENNIVDCSDNSNDPFSDPLMTSGDADILNDKNENCDISEVTNVGITNVEETSNSLRHSNTSDADSSSIAQRKEDSNRKIEGSDESTYFEVFEKELLENKKTQIDSDSDVVNCITDELPICNGNAFSPVDNVNEMDVHGDSSNDVHNDNDNDVFDQSTLCVNDMSDQSDLNDSTKAEVDISKGRIENSQSLSNTEDKNAKAVLLECSSEESESEQETKRKLRKRRNIDNKEHITRKHKDKKGKEHNKSNQKKDASSLSDTSSFISSDTDSNCSTGKRRKLSKNTKIRKKLKLEDTEAYRSDEKLRWKCEVNIIRLKDCDFQREFTKYKNISHNKKNKDDNLKSLFDMKSLKNPRKKNCDYTDEDDSSSEKEKSAKKKRKKKQKEKEEESATENQSDKDSGGSDIEDSVNIAKEKDKMAQDLLKEDEDYMARESLLMISSSSEDEDDAEEDTILKPKKKAKKSLADDKQKELESDEIEESMINEEEETKNSKNEEVEGNEKEEVEGNDKEDVGVIEENAKSSGSDQGESEEIKEKDKCDEKEEEITVIKLKEEESKSDEVEVLNSDGENEDNKKKDKKKPQWKRNKLLCEKLSDTDISEEEEKFRKKRNKENGNTHTISDDDNNSEDLSPRKKKVRRKILHSDSDAADFILSSDSSSSDSVVSIPVKKRKGGKRSSSDESESDSKSKKKSKAKHRRIKAPVGDSSDSDSEDIVDASQKSGDTPSKGRKNIRKVMKDENVAEATKRAAKEEEERRQRILEKQKWYHELFEKAKDTEVVDKLVLDFDPESKEELVSVHPEIVKKLKPHQAKGIKFMWDACFESLELVKKKKHKGSGCILAHCMGLGKTFQVVALVHTLLTNEKTTVNRVLIVCPLSTVSNWVSELHTWPKETNTDIDVYELTKYKQNNERSFVLKDWHENGGVMVIGYDMFRNLVNAGGKKMRKKIVESLQTSLLDPGPDLVVCDEGHLLKNEKTALSKAMTKIRTLRRIVLTGTPLQNNLKEYHCMVQFVKPNLLGTLKEFQNRFVNPIHNGQFENSTAHDVKVMKRRAHVLHKMLEGSVQRFDYSVLTPFLPPKHEYVITVMLSEVQIKLYQHYLDNFSSGKATTKGAKLFSDFQSLSRIWTHPRVLQMSAERDEKKAEQRNLSESEGSLCDFIDDSDAESSSSNSSDVIALDNSDEENSPKQVNKGKGRRLTRNMKKELQDNGTLEETVEPENEQKAEAWWKEFVNEDHLVNIKYSGKLVLLFSILEEAESIGDKVLVFSQSIFSLDLIEYFLNRIDEASGKDDDETLNGFTGNWVLGLDYFRLDGSTPSDLRTAYCKAFNNSDNMRSRLFLISTRAGGLGINLFAANRVIIFDASWNPSHDVQSIFRVYRFGQKKPCYIYRFLAHGTMEEKIYERQVTKLSLACRVVDEQQIERHYNMNDLQELYNFSPEKPDRPTPAFPKDRLLADLMKKHESWIDTYHEHDSLLENQEEEELNEEERKAAWEEYENEKKGRSTNFGVFPQFQGNANTTPYPSINPYALKEAIKRENPLATEDQINSRLSEVLGEIMNYFTSPKGQPQSSAAQANMQQQQQMITNMRNMLWAQQQAQLMNYGNYQYQANPLASNPVYGQPEGLLYNRLVPGNREAQATRRLRVSDRSNAPGPSLLRNPFSGAHRPGASTNAQRENTAGPSSTVDIETIEI